jgi:hypothetical protein
LRFRIRLPILCLLSALLAAPILATAAVAGGSEPAVHAGTLALDVTPGLPSFLPVDTGTLAATLCGGTPVSFQSSIGPRGECNLSVGPPPRIDFSAGEGRASDGAIQVSLTATASGAWQGSALLTTPCGDWEMSLDLDPAARQPISDLVLQPSASDPAQGVFAGEVRLAVRYHLFNRTKGTTVEAPAVVPLELSGHWSIVPEGSAAELPPGASNLELFSGVFAGASTPIASCGPSWGGGACHVCLTPAPNVPERPDSRP